MASLYGPADNIPNIVLIGLPNKAALQRALGKLRAAHIPHYEWHEPDYDFGFTAIATAPIRGEQRDALKNYRVYSLGIAQQVERRGSNPGEAGSSPAPQTNGDGTGVSTEVDGVPVRV